MNNRPMEIDIHHTSREDLIRKVREHENQLDEYNFTNMKLDKEIKELQEELTNQHDRFDDHINSLKCCGNCDRKPSPHHNCMMDCSRQEFTDSTVDLWEEKENHR